jgi:pimeloyl-ACP methyl ester carboxylesterase
MLAFEEIGSSGTLVVMLHWLGGSGRTWTEVAEQLSAAGFRCVGIDLPGFGRSQAERGYSVEEMVEAVAETIRSLRAGAEDAPWVLAGHSMGGKLATLIARRFELGDAGLGNLRGMVLVSPSPPSPEPMTESKRGKALRSLGPETVDAGERRKNAEAFVDDNTGKLPLLDAVRSRSVEDVLRMQPEALAAWMNTGSKVDCSATVGVLDVPVLVLAGTEEPALGPDVQAEVTLPHFAKATLVALEGSGHLSPLERPWELSDRMLEFFRGLGLEAKASNSRLGAEMRELIESDRTSPQTRKVLLQRLEEPVEQTTTLDAETLRMLRALVARVVPVSGFDLAERLDAMLGQSKGDGWRFSTLPADAEAWRTGLMSIDAAARREFSVPFVALHVEQQDELLKRAQSGELGKGLLASLDVFDRDKLFDAGQMRDWFEDVRGEAAKLYVADPRTMERIGFAGFADEAGFTKIRLGE